MAIAIDDKYQLPRKKPMYIDTPATGRQSSTADSQNLIVFLNLYLFIHFNYITAQSSRNRFIHNCIGAIPPGFRKLSQGQEAGNPLAEYLC